MCIKDILNKNVEAQLGRKKLNLNPNSETTTPSRSVQRRLAFQKGEPIPQFDPKDV